MQVIFLHSGFPVPSCTNFLKESDTIEVHRYHSKGKKKNLIINVKQCFQRIKTKTLLLLRQHEIVGTNCWLRPKKILI